MDSVTIFRLLLVCFGEQLAVAFVYFFGLYDLASEEPSRLSSLLPMTHLALFCLTSGPASQILTVELITSLIELYLSIFWAQ